jgi:MerR family redox-sensitive transcriptional activator SoxR
MSGSDLLAIGTLSDATGVAVSALRYYDEVGLIDASTRVGGKRRFEPAVIGRVNFVKRAQGVGFSLDEIGAILDDDAGSWRNVVVEKLENLREQRDELESMIAMLEAVEDCGCQIVSQCPRTAVFR